jgi:ribosomal protein S8
MPYFETYAEVEVEVDDFLSSCGSKEIKQVIDKLKEDGHLSNINVPIPENEQLISDKNWNQNCQKLSEIRLQMSMKDIEVIENILKKY